MVELPKTTTAGSDEEVGLVVPIVAPLTIMASPVGDSEIVCPDTVTTLPGERVCDPKMKFEFESWLIVEVPNRIGAVVGAGDMEDGTPLTTTVLPDGPNEIVASPPEVEIVTFPF